MLKRISKKSGRNFIVGALLAVTAFAIVLSGATPLLGSPSGQAQAASNGQEWFIHFDGFEGESQDKDHKGWSDILSFNQPIQRPGTGGGSARRRGSAILEDIIVTKEMDKVSPKIAEAALQGKVIPEVEIHLTASTNGATQTTYYKYRLTNVMVTSYEIGGSESDGVSMDEFAMNYEEIEVTYTEYDDEGNSKGDTGYEWDSSGGSGRR